MSTSHESSDEARRAREKGLASERRFQSLMSKRAFAPHWIRFVRKASEDDNQKGIDFHIVTVEGEQIPVDVKSSKTGRRTGIRRHGADNACIVVVEEGSTDEAAAASIVASLEEWRSESRKRERP